MMECKTCEKGLVLEILEKDVILPGLEDLGPTIKMDAVACDCCGGFYENCENCEAGKRVILWIDE
jgi:hypothetical protein